MTNSSEKMNKSKFDLLNDKWFSSWVNRLPLLFLYVEITNESTTRIILLIGLFLIMYFGS